MKSVSGTATTCRRIPLVRREVLNSALKGVLSGAVAMAVAWLWILGAATAVQAQGSRKDDIVFNTQGRPMAGATIRICAAGATGQPCSPLANIYSDVGLTQALANPTTTDGLGNYSFYAAPGQYMVEISGPSITTKQIPNVILPNDPSAPTFATVTTTSGISAFSLSLSGNLTVSGAAAVTGALTAGGSPVATTALSNTWTAAQTFNAPVTLGTTGLQAGNVAAKGNSTQNARFVSGSGNDSNDGLSGGSAKATVYGAMADMINAIGPTGQAAAGVIHMVEDKGDLGPIQSQPTNNVAPSLNGGIWIMGSQDPNYVTVTTFARSGGTLTITTASTVPASPYYSAGQRITIFSASDASFDGTCTVTSASGTTIVCPQSGADSTISGAYASIVPIGWIPNLREWDLRCDGGSSGSTPGGSAPICLLKGTQYFGQQTITSISESGSTVTAVMAGGTWYKGLPIEVQGESTAGYNGYWLISSVSGTTITYTDTTTGLASDTTGQAEQIVPGLWLSAVNGFELRDSNVGGTLPVLMGVDSNMSFGTAAASSSLYFAHDTFSTGTSVGDVLAGPSTWIGSNVLWAYFDNCNWATNANAGPNSDQRAAVVMKEIGGATSGLIKIWHGNSAGGGGIRWYQQAGSSGFTVDGFLEEGTTQSQPIVDIMSNVGSLFVELHDLSISDSGDLVPVVRVPPAWSYGDANTAIVWTDYGQVAGNAQGPMTVINQGSTTQGQNGPWQFTGPRVSGQGQGQFGLSGGRAVNVETNAGRSNGPPSTVRFANLAASNPANWSTGEGTGIAITAGKSDRIGGSGAGSLTCSAVGSDGYCSAIAYSGSPTIKVGDYLVESVWVRPGDHSAGFPQNGSFATILTGMPSVSSIYRSGSIGNSPGNLIVTSPPPQNDGGWQHIFLWAKAASAQTSAVNMRLTWKPGNPLVAFDPQFYVISASQVATPSGCGTVTQASGGSLAATTYYIRCSYTNALGETLTSPVSTFAASASNVITVPGPGASTGAVDWNVYICNATGCTHGASANWNDTGVGETTILRQNGSPITIGTGWTEPTSGLVSFSSYYDGASSGGGRTLPPNDTTNVYGDSEIADWALNLGDFNSSCVAGQLCSANGPIDGGAFSTQTSAYTLKASDGWVNVTGTTTITVPHVIVGQKWTVFNSGSNTVTIQADSGNINGAASITLSANTGKEIACDGTNCFAH